MSDPAAVIALACPQPDERALLTRWLSDAGYAPTHVADPLRLDDALQAQSIEALVADVALLPSLDDVRLLLRRLGGNRPLLLVGDRDHQPALDRGELSAVRRPLERDAVLLAVGLALAEGRPARRYPRRFVEPVPATAQGIAVKVTEISSGGVGLSIAARQAVLPPFFNLRIPDFGVYVLVRRAWMGPMASGSVRCGGSIEGDLRGASTPWADFARGAPAPLRPGARMRPLAS